jgi:group I intron endonuclease
MLIYCARNKDNDKMYIGKTTKTLKNRKERHYGAAINSISDTHFHRALRSGAEFEWVILETVSDIDDINEREKFWISNLDTYHTGYNMTLGGDGGCTYRKGDAVYERIKHKLSENSRGDKNPGANPEIHARAQQTILNNIHLGKYFNSGESHGNFKGKFKEIHDKYKGGPAPVNSKQVCVHGIMYDSLRSAARDLDICAETVSNRCRNSRYLEWNFIVN